MKIPLPTPSFAVSIAALVVAAGGGAYAATTQITGRQIKDGTIAKADLTPSLRKIITQRPPRGLPGLPGPAGLTGAAGGFDPAKVSYVLGAEVPANPADIVLAQAFCPPGAKAVGGGHFDIGNVGVSAAIPGGGGWQVLSLNDVGIPIVVQAFAVCAAP